LFVRNAVALTWRHTEKVGGRWTQTSKHMKTSWPGLRPYLC